jgi:DNA helicase II / ATP-dependent DNA helicase PcrA
MRRMRTLWRGKQRLACELAAFTVFYRIRKHRIRNASTTTIPSQDVVCRRVRNSPVRFSPTLAIGHVEWKSTKILFISFARATIARVMEQAKLRTPRESQHLLEINNYHGFAWNFIRTFGYLLTGYTRLRLLPPPEAAGRMAGVPRDDRPAKLRQLLSEEGVLGFDLFAELAADLLERSPRLCRLLSDSYPIIILDEFQDTNLDEWRMISALGKEGRIIALADAEQRIY